LCSGGKMRHFKKLDWSISLSLLFACILTVIAACVEPSGPLDAPHVLEGGGGGGNGGGTTVSSVQLTLAQSTLAPGKTTQATVVARSADGKIVDASVDFVSQNLSIATVSSNGVVTAVAAGIAMIQATVAGHGATAPVTVQSIVVAAVAVAFDSTKISVGHVAQASAVVKDTAGNPITDQAVTWSSLTPNIASVSSSGTVTAIAAGTASIEAVASGVNGAGSIIVEAPSVAPSVASVAVAFDSTRISVGHATQASAVVKDAAGSIMAGQAITWSSLTPGIASVSSSGVVTAIAAGTASIRATASGVNGSASILVVTTPVYTSPDIWSWDFHDGTLGWPANGLSQYDFWTFIGPPDEAIVADATFPSAITTTGYSGQTHYVIDPSEIGNIDRNRYFNLQPVHMTEVSGANTLTHFFTRMWVKIGTPLDTSIIVQRKLLYCFSDANHGNNWLVIITGFSLSGATGAPVQLVVSAVNGGVDTYNLHLDDPYSIPWNQWRGMELEVQLNTPGLSDGRIHLWIYDADGSVLRSQEWAGISIQGTQNRSLEEIQFGEQADRLNTGEAVDEYRWENRMALSRTRIGP
jgi:uncharacterized protein YjdB